MLIDFTIKNFRSLKNEEILSAEAGNRLRKFNDENTIAIHHTRILKNLLLFGPNGSGKSNLLAGLEIMKNMILNPPSKVVTKLPYQPFIFSNESLEPTFFKTVFTYKDKEYSYSFSYNSNEIITEKLSVLNGNKKKPYFERHRNKFTIIPKSLKSIGAQTKKNSLFLYNAQNANDPVSSNVMEWFNNNLVFFDEFSISEDMKKLLYIPEIKDSLVKFLKFADISIEDLKIQQVNVPPFPEKIREFIESSGGKVPDSPTALQIMTLHKTYDENGNYISDKLWNIDDESTGTKKIFLIALSLIYAKKYGDDKTLIFDEFDSNLHVELSKALIKIFNSNYNKSQIISTTHELNLLDKKNLRIDQIYLLEKDFRGISNLKSIFDFKDPKKRADLNFVKWYIKGIYGAYPQIDVKEMLRSLNSISEMGEQQNGKKS